MPRGKPVKKVQKNIENTDPDPQLVLISEETTQPKSQLPAKVVKTVRTEQWTEKPTKVDGVVELENEEEWEDEETDIWDTVFEDFGPADSDWTLRIWKLPSAMKDGKFSIRSAHREYCDDLPLSKDYMQLIKDNWGAGVYHIELKEKSKIKKRKTIHIAPFMTPITTTSTNGHRVNGNGQVVINPIDPMEQVEASLNLITKMRRAFGIGDQTQAAQPQQNQPLSDEAAFIHLAMKSDDVIDTIGRKFRSLIKGESSDHETTTNDLLLAGIQVLPQIFDKAQQMLMQVLAVRTGQPQPQPQSPAPQTPQAPQTPVPIPHNEITAAAPTVPHEQATIDHVLAQMSQFCAQNIDPIQVADWIARYEDLDRSQYHNGVGSCITQYIDLLMSNEPDKILEWIKTAIPNAAPISSLPHAKDWLAGIQKELKAITEPEPEEKVKP